MKYNANDGLWYLTSTEWANTKDALKANPCNDTSKYYEVDTKVAHVIYEGNDYAL
jgi:hypothetical protein